MLRLEEKAVETQNFTLDFLKKKKKDVNSLLKCVGHDPISVALLTNFHQNRLSLFGPADGLVVGGGFRASVSPFAV